MRFPAALVVAAALILVLAGCSNGASSGPSKGASDSAVAGTKVQITDSGFTPAHLLVKVGDMVTWTNVGKIPHTVTVGTIDSQAILVHETYTMTFDHAGTFSYYCRYHPTETGTIEVR